ncbi:hypothetical protein MetMK1DRAFT_00014580 [Metallosphaera yellowstonensis MK1]|jgi:hypothetical protein|uniref:Uncharacterized protein n=1 Tax=Metallosphaera yellowstonensis MK1 TaxID=671065 RepID=H2C459_9CREN|nr:hypothetical protein MetMK1DRAFT_00014580 [Metallosphaera yellowstonensis MK1]
MCYFNISKVDRPIIEKNVVLLHNENFEKLTNKKYISVLSTHEREDMSKSYFYLVLERFREMGLIKDNALAFKVALPFQVRGDRIEIGDGIMYVTENREVLLMDLKRDDLACGNCTVKSYCVQSLKTLAREVKVPLSKANPREAWKELIKRIKENLVENVRTMRISNFDLPKEESLNRTTVTQTCT